MTSESTTAKHSLCPNLQPSVLSKLAGAFSL